MEHKVELTFGYTDKKGVVHKVVTFGKRLTVADLVLLDNNPLGGNATQYEQLIRRVMITKFGTLSCPVALSVLSSLDTMDDDALRIGASQFLRLSRDDRQPEFRESDELKLAIGIDIDGVTYDVVKFGRRLTVADNIEADNLNLGSGVARLCFQICRQIAELRNSESGIKLEGPISPDNLSGADSEDLATLRMGAEFFRLAPSAGRETVRRVDGDSGTGPSEDHGMDRGRDSQAAGGTV